MWEREGAARKFVERWRDHGYEKGEAQTFWLTLLSDVFGIGDVAGFIEHTAQQILDARKLYPDSSLADLYDERTMPPELRKAHQANDREVMKAYDFAPKLSEAEVVAELMALYQKLTSPG